MATTKSEDKATKPKTPVSPAAKNPPVEEAPPELPPAPKAPAETLDLLEPKKKVKRRDADGGGSKAGPAANSKDPGETSRKPAPVVQKQPGAGVGEGGSR